MQSLKFILATLSLSALCLLFYTSNLAQDNTSQNIAAQTALVTEFEVNGLKVLVKRRPKSQTVAVGLFLRGGVKNLTAQNAGIEDLMLDVMSEASAKFPRANLRRELARTGTVVNAGASLDYSAFSLIATREYFDRSWDIFADLAMNPSFAPDDVNRVRELTLTGLRDDEADADGFLTKLSNKTAYANHPYQNAPIGTAENINRFKPEDLRAYHKEVMQTSHLLLVVVGDLDAAQVKSKVEATFGKLPHGNYKNEIASALKFDAPSLEVTARTLPTNYVQGVFAAPNIADADYYPMQVATTILRENVFQEVRTERNLSYAPNAFMNSTAANLGGIYVTAVDANQSVSIMLDEIAKLQNREVKSTAISGVVGQFLTTYYADQETNTAQAAELARYELIGGDWHKAFDFFARIRAVQPEDVRRVSRKYMRNLKFVVVGNPAYINKTIFTVQPNPSDN